MLFRTPIHRRRVVAAFVLAGGLVMCVPSVVAQSTPDEDPTPEATVTRVIDGSTLDAEINGRRVAVGYLGVATEPANQECGRQALQRNRELVGERVLLMSDPDYQFDANGRRLYYAFTVDGVSIDEVLVREGLARAARTAGVEGSQLQAAEAEAAAAGRGCLWQGAVPTG
jgi:endonuclease YncB( thermonuclease family)